jgi:hypothetical protein
MINPTPREIKIVLAAGVGYLIQTLSEPSNVSYRRDN